MTNDDIEQLIEQIKELQIRQSGLLLRLEKARQAEKNPEPDETVSTTPVGPTAPKEPTGTTREFAIGDQVRVRNPNLFQTDKGKIVKIGKTRITIQTKSGTKIQRAPKNLAFTQDE